jgi:hypothetical protein
MCFATRCLLALLTDALVVESGDQNEVDRGADNPTSFIPIMKPVSEAKARSRAVVPLKKTKNGIFSKVLIYCLFC